MLNDEKKIDALMTLFEQEWNSARQMADHRSQMTNFIIVIATAIIGITVQKVVLIKPFFLDIFLIIIGVYGTIASYKYYEKFKFHVTRAVVYRGQIENILQLPLSQMMKDQKKQHDSKFPCIANVRLYLIWFIIPLSITLIGLILFFSALRGHYDNSTMTNVSGKVYFVNSTSNFDSTIVQGVIYSSEP